MWTEREKEMSDFDEIAAYVKMENDFHDYRLGNIEMYENSIIIMIEEDTGNKHNENAHIWNFTFENISELRVSMDCILPGYISEMEIEDHCIMISLNSGYISFTAMKVSLGIPSV